MISSLRPNPSGQVLVETLVMGLPLIGVVALGGWVAYSSFARTIVDYHLDQALLCVARHEAQKLCQQKALQDIRDALPLGHPSSISLRGDWQSANGEIHWQISPDIKIQRKRSWSLRSTHAKARRW